MNRDAASTFGSVDIGSGVQLYYEERGTGPVLLLIHGMWGSSRFFRKQIEGLSSKYRLIAVDLRGHGRSSMTLSDQTVPSYARDIHALIANLGLESFVAVGWSMGAFVCWDYVQQFGAGAMKGLVVVDQPPSDWQSRELPGALISADTLRAWNYRLHTERNALMREVIPMMFARPPEGADLEWMFDEMTRAPEAVAAATLVDQSMREYQGSLWGFSVPMLVCGGGKSAQPRAGLEMIVARASNATLSIFEECGHCLFLEDADRFNAEVDRFAAFIFGVARPPN